MSNSWFTSDWHLGHKWASKVRGFDNVDDHSMHIIGICNSYLASRDVLYILGDVVWDPKEIHWLAQIPCQKYLVRGNHDIGALELYWRFFHNIHGLVKYKHMWLSHCPIHEAELRGRPNIHGHLHYYPNHSPTLHYPYINVNWDHWFRPVCLDEIKRFVEQKKVDYNYGHSR